MDVLSQDAGSESLPADKKRLIFDLLLFFGAAYALTWAICGVYLFAGEWATQTFGPMKLGYPAFYAAVYGPFVAAILVTAFRGGPTGLRSYFSRLVRVKARWGWIAISLLGYPVLWLITTAVPLLFNGRVGDLHFEKWYIGLPAMLLAGHIFTDPGALGEEPGWRGYALPRLLELMTARKAALLLGLIWAVWHLPAFYLAELSQSQLQFGIFVVSVTALSVFMTWLFVNTNGSVIWGGIVPHMMFNATPKAGIDPVGPVLILGAVAVLLVFGKNLRRGAGPVPDGAGVLPTKEDR